MLHLAPDCYHSMHVAVTHMAHILHVNSKHTATVPLMFHTPWQPMIAGC